MFAYENTKKEKGFLKSPLAPNQAIEKEYSLTLSLNPDTLFRRFIF